MKSLRTNASTRIVAALPAVTLAAVAVLLITPACLAQGSSSAGTRNTLTVQDSNQAYQDALEKDMRNRLGDPAEEAAYKAFQAATEADKKIQLGQAFVNKYPNSFRTESVFAELAQTYYSKQDVENFYTYADKGLALNPDDVGLLAMTGWVIPRAYRRDDPFGEGRLQKAEQYEKHALLLMDTLAKPEAMTDQQFALFKNEELATAHSGLGLVYFRRGQLEDSVKELQQATQSAPTPDPTDFYVLGAGLQNLNRFKEAADAFTRCAATPGPLQQDCKQNAVVSTKQAQPAPAK